MNNIKRTPIIWFLIIAFGLAWVLFLIPMLFKQTEALPQQAVTVAFWGIAMWAPGLGAIVATRFAANEPLSTLNLKRLGDKKTYLWAWLIPPLLAIATGFLTWAFRLGELDLNFTQIQEAMQNAPGGDAIPGWLVVAIQSGIALTLGPLINTLFALGEELGWRGFLLPQLLPLGQWKAIVLSGVTWGIWHTPVILQGHNYPSHPVLGVPLMVVFSTLLGVFLSWLYFRTQSPWAPALGHGAVNACAGLPMLFFTGLDITYGGTLASLTGMIPLGLLVVWLVLSKRLPDPNYVSRETIGAVD